MDVRRSRQFGAVNAAAMGPSRFCVAVRNNWPYFATTERNRDNKKHAICLKLFVNLSIRPTANINLPVEKQVCSLMSFYVLLMGDNVSASWKSPRERISIS
jgi:hypothetical protein